MVLILSVYDSVSNQLDIEWVDWQPSGITDKGYETHVKVCNSMSS